MTKRGDTTKKTDKSVWQQRVNRERQARQEAERILETKSRELFEAHEKLTVAKDEMERQLYEIENERDRVLFASRTDLLTRLSNRTAFLKDLETMFRTPEKDGKHLWLFQIDIRRFKRVNASFGQSTGDLVLLRLAERLSEIVGAFGGQVSRFGGAEFAFLVYLNKRSVVEFSEDVRQAMRIPVRAAGREVTVNVAIGGAGTTLHYDSVENFHGAAEFALSCSRSSEDGQAIIIDDGHHRQIDKQRELEARLRRAIDRYKIEPWYQPIVHVRSDRPVSLEVLARWPEAGKECSPAEFIPIAEEIGLRRELDQWLNRSAFLQAKGWIAANLVQDISINVPPNDLMSSDYVQNLDDMLRETQYPRDRLVVEVTESVFIEDLDFVNRQLQQLSDLGVQIALDDFGTGYSNLRSLVGLPLSKIKLDKSLIDDMEANSRVAMLVSTFIQWARAIDLAVVAEGVETDIQAALLKALGCSSLQGYLYGRAMSPEALETHFDTLRSIAA